MRILLISAAYKPAYVYLVPTMSVAAPCEQLVKHGCYINVYPANGTQELNIVPGIIYHDFSDDSLVEKYISLYHNIAQHY